ncbi:MAG: hypothetical protein ACOZNI_21035 [Myxococcota bacterium]
MNLSRFLVPFALGVAAGVLIHKNWPKIKEVGAPLLKGAVRQGSNIAQKTRDMYWEKSEKFSDLIAEIREEEEARAKAGPPTPPAPPPEPKPA